MDFLEKLYSNENFGLYLVIAIAVLVVLFFIVLFLGKKDEKKTKELKAKEREKALVESNATGPIAIQPIGEELEKENNQQAVSLTPAANPVSPTNEMPAQPVAVAPVINDAKPAENVIPAFKEVTEKVPVEIQEEPKVEENVVLNQNISNVNNVADEDVDDETREFDFEALADAINKELESIKESKTVEMPAETKVEEKPEPVISEKPFAFPTFETVEPDKIPEQIVNKEEIKPEVKPVIEERPKMPNVFSSVYVNPKKEKEEVKPEVKPVKPAPFELPKKIDLPKKVEEVKEIPSFLDQIETESYQIDK